MIIDQPNIVQHKQNLIDTDLLDYYHTMHQYRGLNLGPCSLMAVNVTTRLLHTTYVKCNQWAMGNMRQ